MPFAAVCHFIICGILEAVGSNSCLDYASRCAVTQTAPPLAVPVVAHIQKSFNVVKDFVEKRAFPPTS